ncbi:WASP homolog-associated protein with actin, membranes and microtubules [Salminus brasiliensis]|uniref:WASP homolog-associated protein with actin, membranes and microtubules n=1 Tax=Salminus brasiliensis TaxID=930266 RepID=UPI003B82E181
MTSLDAERQDSLDGWVAVRSDIFSSRECVRLEFLVQWSDVEGQFAVTCRSRGPRAGQQGWAALLSASDIILTHQTLSSTAQELRHCLPDLSAFNPVRNLWDLLFTRPDAQQQQLDVDGVCRQLEKYFKMAVELCGSRIVLDTLYNLQEAEEEEEEQFYEDLKEFKRKAMEEQVERAKEKVNRIVQSHCSAAGLQQLMTVYEEEDEAYDDLVAVATQFYQHLLQPFRQMREISMLYKMEIQKSLQTEELGPKRVCQLENEAEEWSKRGQDAVGSIQDITVCYFSHTSSTLTAMLKQMECDRKRFGSAAWAVAMPRLDKLKLLSAKETLQHMRARELCLTRKKQDIRDKMSGVCEGVSEVQMLELQYYEAQLELYDCKLEILKNEELLLLAQIHKLQRQIKELKEEVVYYDACEDPAELQCVQTDSTHSDSNPAHSQLQQQLQQLERKRAATSTLKAKVRNRKESCIKAWELQQGSLQQKNTQHQQHHSVHLKREKRREEDDKKKEWVELEREKTLSRLRSFREKKLGQYVVKAPRSKPKPPDVGDLSQPMSIISLTPPTGGVSQSPSPTARGKGRGQKQKEITVQILLPPGAGPAMPEQTLTPPVLPPPPPPPPLPPPPPPLPSPACPLEAPPLPLSEKEFTPSPKNTLQECAGSMDSVLASLQRGKVRLRKVTPNAATVSTETPNFRDNLLSAIRQGVALKKAPPPAVPAPSKDSELEQSIKAAMLRMKRVSKETDDEDDDDEFSGTQSEDWDS